MLIVVHHNQIALSSPPFEEPSITPNQANSWTRPTAQAKRVTTVTYTRTYQTTPVVQVGAGDATLM